VRFFLHAVAGHSAIQAAVYGLLMEMIVLSYGWSGFFKNSAGMVWF